MPEFMKKEKKKLSRERKHRWKSAHNQMVAKINQCYRTLWHQLTRQHNNKKKQHRQMIRHRKKECARRENILSAKIPIIFVVHKMMPFFVAATSRLSCCIYVCIWFVATSHRTINIRRHIQIQTDRSHLPHAHNVLLICQVINLTSF